MKRRCGKKCFLRPRDEGFPICKKGTCEISSAGLRAAYYRASQMAARGATRYSSRREYKRIRDTARRMLNRRSKRRGRSRSY